ncbi:hypothetical protein IFM51744_01509 [Aspergillus udagawae]|uniref:Uncharacterized protein n=1 Tax=Aspergillus udagawae TaxID=91492 RepID=A0A8H3NM24_9EURO|nr:uncharacterized protein Aud_007923 [Aspergillus udagawae]GFF31630.1 hypothetical protein IFM51744_01509 [Aspergillus udagawae]GFF36206.1 hypothetical protein IFM46972_04809 [Aspergillus udagawae]GIC91479.1 hypothetical protein Aud_007923 [Aspergillus udagawae]
MSSNYNLRSGANPSQDQPGAGGMGDEPEFQSQSQTEPGLQSQQNPVQSQQQNPRFQQQTNQKSQESSFQSSESTKQTSSNDVQWGNQPGEFSASETNPKPPGSYHLTGDQLSHPQE